MNPSFLHETKKKKNINLGLIKLDDVFELIMNVFLREFEPINESFRI